MSRGKTYQVSASARVEQLESELAAQLDALRTEITQSAFFQGTTPKSYCSVQIPKDISYFRAEREQCLKRLLQAGAARPHVSPAEVIQRELESCINREHTPESLPLLLHQHYLDHTHHLMQCKHLLMLRWRRFCRHSTVLEQLYPIFKGQMDLLVLEYEDAVQRARRLAVSRERLLTNRVGPNITLFQEDLVIYVQWLVTHLHSLKSVHIFLQVLHYLPAKERKDVIPSSTKQPAGVSSANGIPVHMLRLEQFHKQLQHLLSHFQLQCCTQDLRTPADEMELFRMVSQEFRVIFQKQEEERALVQYGSTEAMGRQLGRKSTGAALRKEANWLPYIQIKPKHDPCQQNFITKLREQSLLDELLKNLSKYCQLSDPDKAMEALRQHASSVGKPENVKPFALDIKSQGGNSTSQIWTSLYNTVLTSQDSMGKHSALSRHKDQQGLRKSRPVCSIEPLGLEEYLGDGGVDSSESRGAYLTLVYLRYLKIRELQNACLNLLNYMRSVERTLTFDTADVAMEGGELKNRREEWGWMSAVRRDVDSKGGIGSHHQIYSTPVDYQVHCSEFMEFPEVDNHHDYYSGEGRRVRTQDQRGLFVVYDAALRDLEELEHTLLLMASHYIQTSSREASSQSRLDLNSWAGIDVDRQAVLLDLWTCEATFIENKIKLLNCYFEAYQHITNSEERVAMAQVITDIIHRRPQLDPKAQYCVQAYQEELVSLQTHQELIKSILDHQIDEQRRYLQRVWRREETGAAMGFGLPPNYTPKQLVTLCGGSPALKSVFLLEVHPSLCLARQVYQALGKAHAELCQLHGAKGTSERVALEQRLLKQALHYWHNQAPFGASYSPQIQKDLFSEVLFEDPLLVRDVGLAVLRSAEEKEIRSEKDRQLLAVETFSKLLELVTIRHRLLEAAVESEHLAQLYKAVAQELGFDDFHLYLRPVQFEFAVLKDVAEQSPMFITALLEDSTSVDRYVPSSLPLAIQELDVNHTGRFSFHTQEAVMQLLNGSGIENLQVTLACQVTQKNALVSAIKQASLCYWAEAAIGSQEMQVHHESTQPQERGPSSKGPRSYTSDLKHRLAESFVSIQLEKTRPRDEMLNAFIKRREATGTLMQNTDEAAKTKRKLILEFCSKFSVCMSQWCLRAQIIALYHSLTLLLQDFPTICQTHFMIGNVRCNEAKSKQDSEKQLRTDPREFHQRPRALLSADGTVLLNLWFLPHYTETLLMFRGLEEKTCQRALQHMLDISSALHDIVCYTISFTRLGNAASALSSASHNILTADWGGTESISAELWDIQQQVDSLSDPSCPKAVGCLLQLHRQVLLLLFDAATRHAIRKTFLSTGNIAAFQSVNDNMGHALAFLSDSLRGSDQCYQLRLPQPLGPNSPQAQRLFPWRWFVLCHGLHPLDVWDVPPIEFCLQLCLSGLSECSRQMANGELLGVSLLLEEVLSSGQAVDPLQLETTALSNDGVQKNKSREPEECVAAEHDGDRAGERPKDPTFGLEQQRGFLLLWKQLEKVKESWGCHRLGVQQIHNPSHYQHFTTLYRQEIQYPSMRALAQHLGTEREYEALLVDGQPLSPPAGATEAELKTWELLRLLESTECDMIKAVQWKMAKEMTLLLSERARQDTALPTDVWKTGSMKHCPTPERPLIVGNFVHQLLSGGQISDGQVSFSSAHLQECFSALSRDVIGRERSNFLFYSLFYEHLLQQETELLHQREQDVKNLEECHIQSSDPLSKASALCGGLMVELTALRAQLAHLEDERKTLQQQLSLQHRQHYDALVRRLFTTCLQLKSRLDGYHQQMEEDVLQMVGRARREGVDRIARLQKKYGSTKDPQHLAETLVQKEAQQDLLLENTQQRALMRKLQALGQWRETVAQRKLQRELLSIKQREMQRQLACVKVQLEYEQQRALLQQKLEALREAMQHSQREVHLTRKQLSQKSQRLLEVEHGCAQEARMRMRLHSSGAFSVQRLQEEAEDRERVIKELAEQLNTGRRHSQLQRRHSTKELQQVRTKLQQERGLKQEAFQLVSQLQRQVSAGTAPHRCTSTPVVGRSSRTSPILFLRNSRGSPSGTTTRNFRRHDTEETNSAEAIYTDNNDTKMLFSKSKQSLTQLRPAPSEALLPNLTDGRSAPLLLTLQRP